MTTHDKIELPPLPKFDRLSSMHADDVANLLHKYGRECARAAIEADRQRRTPPNEPFAIVIDRMYDGEGPSLAYWNGENYQFTDGDCCEREGDTLDGYTAEFLTDHQLEKRLFGDRKRRGEPVAWKIIKRVHNSDPVFTVADPTDVLMSKYIPLYTAPQPTEPDSYVHTAPDDCETLHWRGQILILNELAAISAEPVKVPSDDIDIEDVRQYLDSWGCLAHPGVRALLDRYGTNK